MRFTYKSLDDVAGALVELACLIRHDQVAARRDRSKSGIDDAAQEFGSRIHCGEQRTQWRQRQRRTAATGLNKLAKAADDVSSAVKDAADSADDLEKRTDDAADGTDKIEKTAKDSAQ